MMKGKILGLLAVGLLAGPLYANAALITFDASSAGGGTISGTVTFNDSMACGESVAEADLTANGTAFTGGNIYFSCFGGLVEMVGWGGPLLSLLLVFDPTFSLGDVSTLSAMNFRALISNSDEFRGTLTQRAAVPEPGTLALLGLGLAGLGLARRRKAH